MKSYDLQVEGMTCASCVTRVEKLVNKFEGVKNVSVNLATERINFETENDNVDLKEIAKTIHDYGYELKLENRAEPEKAEHTSHMHEEEETDEYYTSLKKEFIFACKILFLLIVLTSCHHLEDNSLVEPVENWSSRF